MCRQTAWQISRDLEPSYFGLITQNISECMILTIMFVWITLACGDVAEQIRASSGVITSPGWPFEYPSRINCSWNIRANPGEIITIR